MPNRRAPLCVLVSGGLDSAALLRQLLDEGKRLFPLYLQCGFCWEGAELYWLRRFLQVLRSPGLAPLHVVKMPLRSIYGAHWSLSGRNVPGARSADSAVYLPGRNLLLLSAAAIVCVRRRLSTIALGTLKGNPFGDASPRFFSQFATCLTQALGHPIRILTPLRQRTKTQVVRQASDTPFEFTFSCLKPRGRLHCGHCNKCAERQRAFRVAGIFDPTTYA